MVRQDINIIIGNPEPHVVTALIEDEEATFLPIETSMADILTTLVPVFKSKTQARKAGWTEEIPAGFSQHQVGKFKHLITIIKEKQ